MNRIFSKYEEQKVKTLNKQEFYLNDSKVQTLLHQVAPLDWIPKNYQHYLKDICEKQSEGFSRRKTIH